MRLRLSYLLTLAVRAFRLPQEFSAESEDPGRNRKTTEKIPTNHYLLLSAHRWREAETEMLTLFLRARVDYSSSSLRLSCRG